MDDHSAANSVAETGIGTITSGKPRALDAVQIVATYRHMLNAKAEDEFFTVPIFFRQGDDLIHDRTGVLLAVAETQFIFTAAHDLDLYGAHQLAAYVSPNIPGGHPIPLDGRIHGAESKVDVAIWELSANVVAQLKPVSRFLRLTEIDCNPGPEHGIYVLRGYPSKLVKIESASIRLRPIRC